LEDQNESELFIKVLMKQSKNPAENIYSSLDFDAILNNFKEKRD